MRSREIADVIRRALQRRNTTAYRASLDAGLPGNAIRYVLEERATKSGRLAEICEALGLEFYIGPQREEKTAKTRDPKSPEQDLLGELSEFRKEVLARLSDKADEHDPTRHVEVRELAAAGGGGADADDERVVSRIAFRRDWLDRHGLDPAQCTVIGVQGESMEPTLPAGCAILVNRARRRRHAGGIFVVRTSEGLIVKRAGKDASGAWLLLSDHPAWKSAPWPADAEVIGEVKWMARTL